MAPCERCGARAGDESRPGPSLCRRCRDAVVRAGQSRSPVVTGAEGVCMWCRSSFDAAPGAAFCTPGCRMAAQAAGARAEADRRLAARLRG